MKRISTLFFVFLMAAAALHAADKMSDQDQLWANEKAVWDAFKTGDQKAFSLLADDIVDIESSGVRNKAQMIQLTADFKMTEYTFADQMVQMVDKDTYILHYTCSMKATYKAEAVPEAPNHCSRVWNKRGDKWLGVFHQETPLPPATATK